MGWLTLSSQRGTEVSRPAAAGQELLVVSHDLNVRFRLARLLTFELSGRAISEVAT
jgi:hypothetical protein